MERDRPPAYPIVHVTMRPDGAAQVNLAGDHQVFAGASPEESREHVIAYAAVAATRLARGVRMRLVDEDGIFNLAVYPDGAVQRLEEPSGARKQRPAASPAASRSPRGGQPPILPPASIAPTISAAAAAASDEVPVETMPRELLISALQSTSSRPVAVLSVSTGESFQIRDRAIVGRRRAGAQPPTPDGWVRVEFDDPSGTVSRSHAALQFSGGELWISDLRSANGTTLRHGGKPTVLDETPVQVHSGDTIELGTRVTAVLTIELEVNA